MTMAELETATRERARIIVLVFDNERYGTIRMWQDRRGRGEAIGTDLGSVDFAAVARGLGARGVRVDRDAEFEPALRQAIAEERSTVIHLAVDRRWVSVDQGPRDGDPAVDPGPRDGDPAADPGLSPTARQEGDEPG
jgi:acetolactate synthase-1/2/3 large subunit